MSSPTPFATSLDASSQGNGTPAPDQSGVRASLGTLTGTRHSINQDALTHQPGHFSGVADGVGGGAHGEIASGLLIQQLSSELPANEFTAQNCLINIDRHIAKVLNELSDGPGASVFAAVWPLNVQHTWQVLWVGDCQVTHYQHSSFRWQAAWQSQAQTYQNHQLTPPTGVSPDSPVNMVGCGMSIAPGWHQIQTKAGDRVVIASDGFHKAFTAIEALNLIEATQSPLPLETAQKWCDLARQRGSHDDISVVILEIMQAPRIRWLMPVATTTFFILIVALGWFLV